MVAVVHIAILGYHYGQGYNCELGSGTAHIARCFDSGTFLLCCENCFCLSAVATQQSGLDFEKISERIVKPQYLEILTSNIFTSMTKEIRRKGRIH